MSSYLINELVIFNLNLFIFIMSFFYYCCILLFSYILSDLDIHIIPHSHMDPGWGWTTNEYYNMRVRSVYNNVLSSLQKVVLRAI